MQGEQKPSSSCCWAPWREWDEKDSLSLVFSRNSLLTFSRSLQTFHMWKWGSLFYLPIYQSLLWQPKQKAFPFQLHGEIPRESATSFLPQPWALSGTQKGLSQSKVTATVSPPSQVTRFLLKVIIFVFLIPKAPSIRRNTLCRKGSDSSRVQPWRFRPNCATDLCACLCWVPGNTTAKSTYTSEVFDPGRQNTLSKGEGGETRM